MIYQSNATSERSKKIFSFLPALAFVLHVHCHTLLVAHHGRRKPTMQSLLLSSSSNQFKSRSISLGNECKLIKILSYSRSQNIQCHPSVRRRPKWLKSSFRTWKRRSDRFHRDRDFVESTKWNRVFTRWRIWKMVDWPFDVWRSKLNLVLGWNRSEEYGRYAGTNGKKSLDPQTCLCRFFMSGFLSSLRHFDRPIQPIGDSPWGTVD